MPEPEPTAVEEDTQFLIYLTLIEVLKELKKVNKKLKDRE